MKDHLIFISDTHLLSNQPVARTDKAPEACMEKFVYIFERARAMNAVILQAGDLLNAPRDWYLLPVIVELLKQFSDVPLLCVYGQHDSYQNSRHYRPSTSSGVLNAFGLLHVLGSEPYMINDFWAVYGASWQDKVPLPKEGAYRNILVTHAPIAHEPAYVGHDYRDAEEVLDTFDKYDIILCGDIHRSFRIAKHGRHIFNTGPMFRYKADEYNFTHTPHFI